MGFAVRLLVWFEYFYGKRTGKEHLLYWGFLFEGFRVEGNVDGVIFYDPTMFCS